VERIVADVRRCRAAVVTAAPGAGKTTRVPPALVGAGPLILLQPRRVAARAIASRIAAERGWTVGREVGWQIRFEKRFTSGTGLLVVTEGILTARLQSDPLLSDFRTIVLDEFHERSIHADLAIALARQAWQARDDLRLVVMSATLDAARVSAFLGNCPIIDVPGRLHPIAVEHAGGRSVADAAADLLTATNGQVLCFLPGAPEIHRTMNDLQRKLPQSDVDLVPLHGSLDADGQDRALAPSPRRRIILATNIAETSVTVPDVTAVVDSGLHKIARYDADRGIDSLETERITADAADQRAGRAGRLGPGLVWRLWDKRDRLRPHREAEIQRVDLSATVLDVIAWGGDPRTLEWFERPREDRIDAAIALLIRLGLVTDAAHQAGPTAYADRLLRLTEIGEQVRHLPLHPRLARMLVEARGAPEMAQACAVLAERHLVPARTASTTSDLLSAIDDWRNVPAHVRRAADVIAELGSRIDSVRAPSPPRPQPVLTPSRVRPQSIPESGFRHALLAGYPDRVAQRRGPASPAVRLSSGAGAVIGQESGVRDGEFLIALDVHAPAGRASADAEARIRLASRVEREWLKPTSSEIAHRFDHSSGTVKAARIERYDALVLSEHAIAPDPDVAAQLLAEAWLERGPRGDDERLLRRLRFAGLLDLGSTTNSGSQHATAHSPRGAGPGVARGDPLRSLRGALRAAIDVTELVRSAARRARRLDEIRIEEGLPANVRRILDDNAPEAMAVPSGRHARLEYSEDGMVSASVKLQELFGVAETPRVGPRREPVLLALLAPNGRPVQLTRDLRSFWDRTYPEVRKELRGRYPKHPWPEDPWNAPPTHRTKARER
jgi:ATP-dependent helicase HrpB